MSARTQSLPNRFIHEHEEVLKFVDGCSADGWQVMVPDEQSTVGVVAQHIDFGYALEIDAIRTMVAGQPPPEQLRIWEVLNAINARNAIELRDRTPAEARSRLCNGAERAEQYLRGLSDEELARTASIPLLGGASQSVDWFIDNILVGHPGGHLAGIGAAINGR